MVKRKSSSKKGMEFQEEVEKYFRKLTGDTKKKSKIKPENFGTVVNRGNKPGEDIILVFKNVAPRKNIKILIQAKDVRRYNIYSLINEYQNKIRNQEADLSILVINTNSIQTQKGDKNLPVDDSLKNEILKKNKIAVWDKRRYEYYKRLIDTLGTNARFSLFSDLQLKYFFDKEKYFPAYFIKVDQKDSSFFITKLPPQVLLKASYVLRRNLDIVEGFQRLLNKKRITKNVPNDVKYGDKPERLFPSSVVCYLDDGIKLENNKLLIPLKYGSLCLIDGQHRVYGLSNIEENEIQNFEIPCAIFEKDALSQTEQSQLFVSINKKATPPPPNLLWDLDRASILTKITRNLNRTKIFSNRIDFGETKSPNKISATTFISGLQTILKEKLEKNERIRYGYLTKLCNDDVNAYSSILKNYFKLWSNAFKKEWGKPEKYIIGSNRGMRVIFKAFQKIFEFYGENKKLSKEAEKNILSYLKHVHNRILEDKRLKNENVRRTYLGAGGADQMFKDIVFYIGEKDIEFEIFVNPLKEKIGIDPKTTLDKIRDILNRAHRSLIIADPYFDDTALINIGSEFRCKEIKILTTDTHAGRGFRKQFDELKRKIGNNVKIEIKIVKKEDYIPHYAFFIIDESFLYKGDARFNLIGKNRKCEFYLREKEELNEELKSFNEYWIKSTSIENYKPSSN